MLRQLLAVGTCSLPSLPAPKVLDAKPVKLSPSLKSLGPRRGGEASLSARSGEGAKITNEAEAGSFDLSGANVRTSFKCSHSFRLFTNGKPRDRGSLWR